jgi:hypothetical protein
LPGEEAWHARKNDIQGNLHGLLLLSPWVSWILPIVGYNQEAKSSCQVNPSGIGETLKVFGMNGYSRQASKHGMPERMIFKETFRV